MAIMERGVVVRGTLRGRHIELDERVDELEGEVEVFLRSATVTPRPPDVLEVIATMLRSARAAKRTSTASSPMTEQAGPTVADVYLDACCFIYLVEGQPTWRTAVEQRLRDLEPTSMLVTSQLARLECRSNPMRDGNRALLERYDMLFGAGRVAVLDVSTNVIDRATDLRGRYGFKSPDAIHLATAIESGATAFWTGDNALSRCADIVVTALLPAAP